MHSERRDAINTGLLRRQITLLEAIAEASGADITAKEQCDRCGEWYESVPPHKRACGGPPGVGDNE